MTNLLKSDFYKLLKSKHLYICIIISIAITIMSLFSTNFTYNYMEQMLNDESMSLEVQEIQENYNFVNIKPNVVNQIPKFFANELIFTLIAISISMFCTADFKSGTIKNIASKGFRRENIYLSKFIFSIFICFAIILINFVVFLIGASIFWEFGNIPNNFVPDLLRLCGLQFLTYIAITSFFTMISMLVKQNGVALSINISILYFYSLIVKLISIIIHEVFKSHLIVENYCILYYPSILANYSLSSKTILTCSLVSIISIALFTVLGIYSFTKRDIK